MIGFRPAATELRLHKAYSRLGVDAETRALVAIFLVDRGDWGERALSTYSGIPRSTVKRRLVTLSRAGVVVLTAVGGSFGVVWLMSLKLS